MESGRSSSSASWMKVRKMPPLRFAWRILVVKIQAGLTQPNNFGLLNQAAQLVIGFRGNRFGIVRVHPDRGKNIGVVLGQRHGFFVMPKFARRSNRNKTSDAGLACPGQEGGPVFVKLRVGQMTVRIGQAHDRRLSR